MFCINGPVYGAKYGFMPNYIWFGIKYQAVAYNGHSKLQLSNCDEPSTVNYNYQAVAYNSHSKCFKSLMPSIF